MILITGASGGLGKLTYDRLRADGIPVLAGSRTPDQFGENGRLVDFDQPGTLDFAGVKTLVLISAGYAEDDVVTQRHEAVITAAENQGVKHVIYTSLSGAGDHLGFALAHRWTERRLQRSSLKWTILRNGIYAELLGILAAPTNGVLTAPFGTGALAAVAKADLADITATVASAPEQHAGRSYELVGQTAISAEDIARGLGIEYRPGSLGETRKGLNNAGLLPFQPAMLLSIYSTVAGGFLAETTSDLGKLLGKAPRETLPIALAHAG